MFIKGHHHQIKVPILVLVLIFYATPSVNAFESRKLDDTTVPAATNGTEVKCGPCGTNYPPPPPPPYLPPPSPPPPSPKKPPTQYCPPPPPSTFIYITGPPGNLYPVDENFNGAISIHRHRNLAVVLLPLLVGFFTMFW